MQYVGPRDAEIRHSDWGEYAIASLQETRAVGRALDCAVGGRGTGSA